jgi:AraC-like DNA-binding protein
MTGNTVHEGSTCLINAAVTGRLKISVWKPGPASWCGSDWDGVRLLVMKNTRASDSASEYREFAPARALGGDILCLWEQRIVGSQGEYAHRVLPDGCIDIVQINNEEPIVVGPWTESFIAQFAPGTRLAGARFHPGRAMGLLGVPASELLNRCMPLRDVWRRAACEPFSRIAEEENFAAKRSALEAALLSRLRDADPPDREVAAAMRWLSRFPESRVEQLSRWIGMSGRQLQRRFCAAVGYGPKMFQSVLRFQRLLNLGGGKRDHPSLAQLSMDAGYADQPHMSREVRRFSGIAPAALLPGAGCTLRMSGLVRTPDGLEGQA